MRRLALTLATAVLGTGCIIGDDDDATVGVGSVIVYWDFVRNAPAQPGGAVLVRLEPRGRRDRSRARSRAVEVVDDRLSPARTVGQLPRSTALDGVAVQGATLDGAARRAADVPDPRLARRLRRLRPHRHARRLPNGQVTEHGVIDVRSGLARRSTCSPISRSASGRPVPTPTAPQAGVPNIAFDAVRRLRHPHRTTGRSRLLGPAAGARLRSRRSTSTTTPSGCGASRRSGPTPAPIVFDSCDGRVRPLRAAGRRERRRACCCGRRPCRAAP